MFYHVKNVLSADQLALCRQLLQGARWLDGRVTAGSQAALAKNNLQLDEKDPIAQKLRDLVLKALSQNAAFFSAALPRSVYPPLFNCYRDATNAFAAHVDNAIRTDPSSARSLRTDMSFTLFLSEASEYDGGELVMHSGDAQQRWKLPAGDALLYSANTVHEVTPVTRGTRLACFSWLQSMVRDDQQRQLLHTMDNAIVSLREQGENDSTVALTSCYHNLLRMWAEL
jgi:PKHD-type hydroxylase